jgi:D-cysteine desulfhydrase
MDLARFPRRQYTAHPTPVELLPALSAALGDKVHLWIKRDDQLGLTGGGNKTRKLEFVMADAIENHQADTIVTCGAVQSNHCRLTLSACVKEGLRCILVVEERVPHSYDPAASGNNFLFRLLGAERIVKVGLGEAPAMVDQIAQELRTKEGRKVYCIPGGASNALGATGYAACAAELQWQQFANPATLPKAFHTLVTASGSGGTHAGLVAGMVALRCPTRVLGISTRHPVAKQTAHIFDLATRVYQHIMGSSGSDNLLVAGVAAAPPAPLPAAAVQVLDDYVGPGYSLPTEGMKEAVTLFARTEGILLDPVYSGKAAAGLIDLVRKGYFPEGSHVLFLHTGGAPTLYHYQPLGEAP